ncbi:MAG: FAD-binding oxidoreductase [Pseudomonadota bacterium]
MTRARGGRSWLHANGDYGTWPRTIYAEGLDLPAPWPPLDGDATADLCVVGGGITGLSAALHAARAGLSVILLEAQRVGWGASGRNGGQVGSGYNWGQADLAARLGQDAARDLWALAEEAKALTRDLIAAHAPEADYRPGILSAARS